MTWFSKFFKKDSDAIKNPNEQQAHEELPKEIILEGIGSSNKIIQDVYMIQRDKLFEWRERYSKEEYPYKVVSNIVYQTLQLEFMWKELHKCFSPNVRKFDNYDIAYNFVMKLKEISIANIRSKVEQTYKTRDFIGNFNITLAKQRVSEAQKGDNEILEKIEKTYLWYTGGVELMYCWAAYGLIGLDYYQAVSQVCPVIIPVDYENINEMQNLFGNNINLEYHALSALYSSDENNGIQKNNWQLQSTVDHVGQVMNFIETEFPLKVLFHDVLEIKNIEDIKLDAAAGKITSDDAYASFYVVSEEKCYILYNYLYTFDIPKLDYSNKKIFVCWIAIEKDDSFNLVEPSGEIVIGIHEFTDILKDVLQRLVLDVDAIMKGGTYYHKFSWVIMI